MVTTPRRRVNARASQELLPAPWDSGQRVPVPDLPLARPGTPLATLLRPEGNTIRIACDTEYEGAHTLTIQFAARWGDALVVQLYRSPDVPDLPAGFSVAAAHRDLKHWCSRIILRPVKVITPTLSPVQVLTDLFQLGHVHSLSRPEGDARTDEMHSPDALNLTLIAHHWPADFFRVFGRNFFGDLTTAVVKGQASLYVEAYKLMRFRERNRPQAPLLEYLRQEGVLYPVRVNYFDTSLPFGKGPLDRFAEMFLGVQKWDTITLEDKRNMLTTFQKKTADAYQYALRDPLLTLLVEEKMREQDRQLYITLGFDPKDVPQMRSTLGSRVAQMLCRTIIKDCAQGSVLLSRTSKPLADGSVGPVSQGKVQTLLRKGSSDFLDEEKVSRFGKQIGDTHGGLLFSRSPTQFFHDAPGHLRDVDLSGCYASIISGMNLYVGRPVVYEPGARGLTLKEAVASLQQHAAGDDAWVVKVSGKVKTSPNVLIPSTKDALTNANYQQQTARRQAKARRFGAALSWIAAPRKDTGNTALYTSVVEGGVVAWSTWLMIQALPPKLRDEYERLEVDTLLFYPKAFVADSGEEYDRLVRRHQRRKTPWAAKLDMEGLRQVTVEHFDSSYISLRFPVGLLAKHLIELRQEAKKKPGKEGKAESESLKQQANTMYGVAASKYLATNNVVYANIITATARTLAYAMQLSLNGIQVITDGCTYRRDQVPAGTFADCLQVCKEYPMRRTEKKLAFLDPASIPQDDAAFTAWYRKHVCRFFGVTGLDYERLFGIHALEHKKCGEPEQAAFDGLCCDGPANYVKLLRDGATWKMADFKARGFSKEAKELLFPWMLDTYSKDCFQSPPPLTESEALVSYKDGRTLAKKALDTLKAALAKRTGTSKPLRIWFPQSLSRGQVRSYKVIKPSSFLYRMPGQRSKIEKEMEKFSEKYACGLELLALRRSHSGRRQGSLIDIATEIYDYIVSGDDKLSKKLNLTRPSNALKDVQRDYCAEMQRRKQALRKLLYREMNVRKLTPAALLTGLIVEEGHAILVE